MTLALTLLLACDGPAASSGAAGVTLDPPEDAPVTTAAPLRFYPRTTDDFLAIYEAVRPYPYDTSRPAPPIVIELPGGVFEGTSSLSIGEDDDPNLLDITIVGHGTKLVGVPLDLAARRLAVSDVVVDGRSRGRPLSLSARESITLEHVSIVGLREPETGRGSLPLRGAYLQAIGPTATLTLRDSLLLGNRHPVYIGGLNSGDGFTTVRFERVRFADNATPELRLGAVGQLAFQGSVRLGAAGPLLQAGPRTLLLSEPEERPADPTTLAAWRAEIQTWGMAAPP